MSRLTLLIYGVTVIQNAAASLSTTVVNMTIQTTVGDDVMFDCRTNETQLAIRWRFYPAGSALYETVYNGVTLRDSYGERHSVTLMESGRNVLAIVNVRITDAGTYSCWESTKKHHLEFKLIVYARPPEHVTSAETSAEHKISSGETDSLSITRTTQMPEHTTDPEPDTNYTVYGLSGLLAASVIVLCSAMLIIILNKYRQSGQDQLPLYENASEIQKVEFNSARSRVTFPAPAACSHRPAILQPPDSQTATGRQPAGAATTESDNAFVTRSSSSGSSASNGNHRYSEILDSGADIDNPPLAGAVAETEAIPISDAESPYDGLDPGDVSLRQHPLPAVYSDLGTN